MRIASTLEPSAAVNLEYLMLCLKAFGCPNNAMFGVSLEGLRPKESGFTGQATHTLLLAIADDSITWFDRVHEECFC